MNTALKSLALAEGKELQLWLNDAITKTTNRSWQLLAFVIAIDVYISQSVIAHPENIFFKYIIIIALPISMFIFYKLYYAILPMKLRANGTEPDKGKTSISHGEEYFYDTKLHTVQISININREILQTIVNNYKSALKSTIIMVALMMLFAFCFFLFT